MVFILGFAKEKIQSQEKEIHVLFLAGQSNMAGHGDFDQLSPKIQKRIEAIKDRVLLSVSDNPKNEAKPIAPRKSKPSDKYPFTKHFGPEMGIALVLAEKNPNQKYFFIKKAVGGTSLYGAWNSNYSKEKASFSERGMERKQMQLYKAHHKQIHQELQKLEQKGIPYKIIGMAWMQGESDTNKPETANAYQGNLQLLIQGYRKEFNQPNLPFVFGQVNPLPRKFKNGPQIVRSGMERLAKDDNFIQMVETPANLPWGDFPKHPDNLHYTHEGQMLLGTLMGTYLLK